MFFSSTAWRFQTWIGQDPFATFAIDHILLALDWYHAEAVELEESKILEPVGFKCCRCRRIRSPVCPYSDAECKKHLDERKIRIKCPKKEILERNPDLDVVSQQVKVELVNTILHEEVVYATADDRFTHSGVNQYSEFNQATNYQWNNRILRGTGPQKLPIRRHNKREKDADHPLASDLSNFELSNFGGNPLNSAQEALTPNVEWGISTKGFDDVMTFDYEGLNYEEMEFEPQTFSLNELLASDDVGILDGVESSANVTGSRQNLSVFPADEVMSTSSDLQEPAMSFEGVVNTVPCKMCSHAEPCPDLFGQLCAIWIHSHCSPWDEQSFPNEGWRCGNCREWQ